MAWEKPFIDGFDHYDTATMTAKWPVVESTSSTSISTVQARHGGQSLRATSNNGHGIFRGLGGDYRTLVAGMAVYPASLGGTAGGSLIAFLSTTIIQIKLSLTETGHLKVSRNTTSHNHGSGTLLGASPDPLPLEAWSHVEFRVYLDSTNGEWEVRLNGATWFSGTGNTINSGNTANTVRLGGLSSCTAYYDDFNLRFAAGYEPGGFFGDCKVLTRLPDGPGSAAQLTSSSGNPNWQNVNTALPDLATYNHSLTPGDKDLYAFAALNDPGAIRAVQVNLLANKSDAGLRLIVPRIKSGATEEAGAAQALSTDNRYYTRSWEVDPNTAAAWTAANLDAAEFGAGADE